MLHSRRTHLWRTEVARKKSSADSTSDGPSETSAPSCNFCKEPAMDTASVIRVLDPTLPLHEDMGKTTNHCAGPAQPNLRFPVGLMSPSRHNIDCTQIR